MNWSVLVAFLIVQLGIGAWASRRVASREDYLVAGRRLGLPLVGMSMFATWFGAETCLGSSGAIYAEGLSGGRAEPFGYAICLALVGLLLARQLHQGQFLTLGDLFRVRFGPHAERVLVLVLVPGSILWGAAQVRAFGHVVAATSHLDVQTATVLSTLFAITYTFFGGLLGDVVTDLVQGTVLCVGLVVLFGVALADLPGTEVVATALTSERLTIFPPGESWFAQVDRWAIPVFGSLVTQEMAARILGARTAEIAKKSAYFAALLYVVMGSIPVVLGLLGPVLVPNLADPEQLLPMLAEEKLPHALHLLFACALLSAILSTVDSIFLSASTLLSHNFFVPLFRVTKDATQLWLSRGLVVASGLTSLWLALAANSIYELLQASATIGAAGLLVATLGALFAPRRTERAAVLSLVVGAIATPIAERLGCDAPFLLAVLASVVAFVLGLVGTAPNVEDGPANPARA